MRKKKQLHVTLTGDALAWWYTVPKRKRSETLDKIIKGLIIPVPDLANTVEEEISIEAWLNLFHRNQGETVKILGKIHQRLDLIDRRLARLEI